MSAINVKAALTSELWLLSSGRTTYAVVSYLLDNSNLFACDVLFLSAQTPTLVVASQSNLYVCYCKTAAVGSGDGTVVK